MKTERTHGTDEKLASQQPSPLYELDPLRQRYLRMWFRLHLVQEYESLVVADLGTSLTVDECRRLVRTSLFSIWSQARKMGLRLPPLGNKDAG